MASGQITPDSRVTGIPMRDAALNPPAGEREAVDTTLRAAALLLQSGGSGNGAELAVIQIADRIAPPDATFTFAGNLVAAYATAPGGPFSLVLPIVTNGANLERASAIEVLGERVASGETDPATIPAELDRIAAIPDPYGPWEILLAAVVAGIAWSMLLGGGTREALLAVAATAVGRGVQVAMQSARMPPALVVFIAAAAASLAAAVGVRAGVAVLGDAASIPAIAWLIPGLAFINGLIDLLSIRHAALGIQRTMVALVMFLLIGAAIAIGVAAGGG